MDYAVYFWPLVGFIDKKEIEIFVNKNSQRDEDDRINPKLSKYIKILKRITFVSDLARLDISDSGHLGSTYTYLILTCFDILGEDDNWLDFNSWMNSKKEPAKKMKTEVLTEIANNINDPIEITKLFSMKYSEHYGVTKTFIRNLNNLPDTIKQLLHESIILFENHKDFRKQHDAKIKNEFIFGLRNLFTHSGQVAHLTLKSTNSEFLFKPNMYGGACLIQGGSVFDKKKYRKSSKSQGQQFNLFDWPDILNFSLLHLIRIYIQENINKENRTEFYNFSNNEDKIIFNEIIDNVNYTEFKSYHERSRSILNQKWQKHFNFVKNRAFAIDVSLISVGNFTPWILYSDNFENIGDLILCIVRGLESQGGIFKYDLKEYGKKWSLQNIETSDVLSEISYLDDYKKSLNELNIKPGMIFRIVDEHIKPESPSY